MTAPFESSGLPFLLKLIVVNVYVNRLKYISVEVVLQMDDV